MNFRSTHIVFLLIAFPIQSCKKLVAIPPPTGSIVTSQVFSTDEQATSAASSMYYGMINKVFSYSSSGLSIFGGLSADEFLLFDQSNIDQVQFQNNKLFSTNSIIGNGFWTDAYSTIYSANAILEGLSNYNGVHDSIKNELTGESKFIRAFCNFYLVNLFGDIPLVTTTNWHNSSLLSRTLTQQVYTLIISDLEDAQKLLSTDYSVGHGNRIIPNKWAATALLARVQLYLGHWSEAETQATNVINNSELYDMSDDLKDVFLTNSNQAIWQLQQDNVGGSSKNATPEGDLLIPRVLDSIYPPFIYITKNLLNAFEPGDQRKLKWLDSTTYNGVEYYFPYKYKVGPAQEKGGAPSTEYYMVLRLAEQYLIRSEARANLSNISGSQNDLNTVRNKAGLPNTLASTVTDLLIAISNERQIELFAEWGHRWLDLKRTNNATTTLSNNKNNTVSNNSLLFPIPVSELQTDPNLSQNSGY